MPYLTNLAAIARGAGLKVVEQAGWQSRGHGPMSGVKTIVAHHTAGPATGNAPSLSIVQNGRSDLPGPLAHFVLGRDGTVFVVAAGQCWHTGATWQPAQSNAYAIGIEAEATGTTSWPEVQLDAYARLCRALCAAFGLGVDRVQGHKEICSPTGRKTDPNFDMGAFRARVAAGEAPSGGGSTGGGGTVQDQEDDEMITVPAGTDDHVNVIVKGKTKLYLACSWGRTVKATILFYGDTGPDLNGTGVGGAKENITFMSNRPGPIAIPDGAAMATIRYTADHSFGVGAA